MVMLSVEKLLTCLLNYDDILSTFKQMNVRRLLIQFLALLSYRLLRPHDQVIRISVNH